MKTMQAEYKTDIALLAKTLSEVMAKRDTEAAKRETRLILKQPVVILNNGPRRASMRRRSVS